MTTVDRPTEPEEQPPDTPPARPSRRERLGRHVYRVKLYTWAVVFVASLVVLVLFIAANVRTVKLDWVVGSTHASLVWVMLAATVLGWILGVATSVLFRYRTRSRKPGR